MLTELNYSNCKLEGSLFNVFDAFLLCSLFTFYFFPLSGAPAHKRSMLVTNACMECESCESVGVDSKNNPAGRADSRSPNWQFVRPESSCSEYARANLPGQQWPPTPNAHLPDKVDRENISAIRFQGTIAHARNRNHDAADLPTVHLNRSLRLSVLSR